MRYDLKKVREKYQISLEEFASLCGITPYYYECYEKDGEVPCQYIYRLWKQLPNFPIPDDFFCYTSFSLCVNMKYHRLKQAELAEKFGVQQQTISHYLTREPILMYEMKDKFLAAFNPMIMPMQIDFGEDGTPSYMIMNNLTENGNFLSAKRKKIYKIQRQKLGLSTAEHKRIRNKNKSILLKAYNPESISVS